MIEAIHSSVFLEKPEVVSSAPGVVPLIGEHADYSGGFMLAIGINRRTEVSLSSRLDGKFVIYGVNFEEIVSFDKETICKGKSSSWYGKIQKLICGFIRFGFDISGANICIASDIPLGFGFVMASEVAVALGLRRLFNLDIDEVELLKICGGGIAGKIVSAFAKEGSAVLVDCQNLSYEYVKFPQWFKFLLLDTGINSAFKPLFSERKKEHAKALSLISTLNPQVTSLRDLTFDELGRYRMVLGDLLLRRVIHIVGENERVVSLVVSFRRGDFKRVRKIFVDSQISLRDNFGVSGPVVDALLGIFNDCIEGAIGLRFSGSGFGVVIARRSFAGKIIRFFSEEYFKKFGRRLKIYVTSAEAGAGVTSIG